MDGPGAQRRSVPTQGGSPHAENESGKHDGPRTRCEAWSANSSAAWGSNIPFVQRLVRWRDNTLAALEDG